MLVESLHKHCRFAKQPRWDCISGEYCQVACLGESGWDVVSLSPLILDSGKRKIDKDKGQGQQKILKGEPLCNKPSDGDG